MLCQRLQVVEAATKQPPTFRYQYLTTFPLALLRHLHIFTKRRVSSAKKIELQVLLSVICPFLFPIVKSLFSQGTQKRLRIRE